MLMGCLAAAADDDDDNDDDGMASEWDGEDAGRKAKKI